MDRVPEQQLTFITLLRASFAAAGFAGIAAALLLLAASAGFCWLLCSDALLLLAFLGELNNDKRGT